MVETKGYTPPFNKFKAALTLTHVQVLVPKQVICTDDAPTRGAFKVTRTSTNTCNSVAIKNWRKLRNILNYLQKFTLRIAKSIVCLGYVKVAQHHLFYVLYK